MDHNIPNTGLVHHSLERITNWNINPGSQGWPPIIAHRGDTSSTPENTMPAFYGQSSAGPTANPLLCRPVKRSSERFTDPCIDI